MKKPAKGLQRIEAMKASLPPGTAPKRATPARRGVQLMITVPPETLVALKARAGKESSTVRVLVLAALKREGFPVPSDELVDHRRNRE